MINNNVFKDTKKSLIKINIIVVGGFLIIFSLFIYSYFYNITNSEIENKLKDEIASVTSQLSRDPYLNSVKLKDPRDILYIYKDNIKYFKGNTYYEGIISNENNNIEDGFFNYSENSIRFRGIKISIGNDVIKVLRDIEPETSSLKQLLTVLIIGVIVSIMITYYVAIYLTKKALVPIETAWSNQEKFIQDASHELRTPIAIVSSKLETMLKNPSNTIGDEVESVADAMKETRRIKKMIGDLLSLTKEDAIINSNIEIVNIENLLNEISNDYSDIANIQEKMFNISIDLKNKDIITDKNKLRQLILIFIDNAFKYTKKGDGIFIKLREGINSTTKIYIKDTGVGIKRDELPFIFDRFFRGEIARSKDIDGSGIGLSIAKKLAISLNSKISVKSILGEGTQFEIDISELSKNK